MDCLGVVLRPPRPPDEAAPEEMPGEMSTEEETFRRAEMDALLALQSTSMDQYDDI